MQWHHVTAVVRELAVIQNQIQTAATLALWKGSSQLHLLVLVCLLQLCTLPLHLRGP